MRVWSIGCLAFIAALPGCHMNAELTPATGLKEVESLRRKALFVAKDSHLHVLDVAARGQPEAVFKIPGAEDFNSRIAIAHTRRGVFISDGRAIYHVEPNGRPTTIIRLDDVKTSDADIPLPEFHINWFLAADQSDQVFYFVVLPDVTSKLRAHYAGRLDVTTRALQLLELQYGAGIAVDTQAAIVYSPALRRSRAILVQSFHGRTDRTLPVSHEYSSCELSADRQKLLVSGVSQPSMAVVDLVTGSETVLPFPGSHAVWGGDSTIFFLRGEHSLWRYELGADEPQRLLTVGPVRNTDRGSYATPPRLSRDNMCLAWDWAAQGRHAPILGTVLIDLENKEFRRLDGWWHNTQWIE